MDNGATGDKGKTELAGLRIELVTAAPIRDMISLYKDAGWWEDAYDNCHGFLVDIPKKSALFAGAFLGNKMIGMGRALSDLCSDGYIQDIAVLTRYRGNGIGQQIVQHLAQELKSRGVDWIGLVAEPGTQLFYEKMGFTPLKDYIPLKLEG